MIVVAPLLSFLPRNSALWRPANALWTGLIVGPLAGYILVAAALGALPGAVPVFFCLLTAFPGAIFAFRYSVMLGRMGDSSSAGGDRAVVREESECLNFKS